MQTKPPAEPIADGILEMLQQVDATFEKSVAGYDLATAPARALEIKLESVACDVDELFRSMLEERRRVEREHPWRAGLLFVWMCDQVATQDNGDIVSRFQVFQNAGYWGDRTFQDWATESAGVEWVTIRGWMNAVRTYLLSDEGNALLEQAQITPMDFMRTVPMDKAIRAAARVPHGTLDTLHVQALLDEGVTSDRMRHLLRLQGQALEEAQEKQAALEQEWVATGGESTAPGSPFWQVHYDEPSRVLRIQGQDASGKHFNNVVARFTVSTSLLIERLQEVMLQACIKEAAEQKQERQLLAVTQERG
jgi:hypothetical protein